MLLHGYTYSNSTYLISILCRHICNFARDCTKEKGVTRSNHSDDWNIKLKLKILTCNLLKLLHTGTYHRSIVFTDADKSKVQERDKSWYKLIYSLSASSTFAIKVNDNDTCTRREDLSISGPYWGFLFLLGRSSPMVCRPTKMWCDSLKSLRRMGEYMSSSFLTSWIQGHPDPLAPENTGQKEIIVWN